MPSDSQGLRIIFAGTPVFAAHHLQALIESQHQIVAVYTQPDRPAGRGKKLSASPVKTLAQAHDLPVYQPLSLKDSQAQQALAAHRADVMIVVAYGLILPQAVLDTPRYGCLNVHGSLLPRWRGAAPIQRAVAAGDKESGITIMQMDKGLDTGDMLLKVTCTLDDNETSGSLHDKLMALGAPALLEALTLLAEGRLSPEAQDDSQANYAEKISKEEAEINWAQPAVDCERLIRAYNPFPVAYTFLDDQRIKCYQGAAASWSGEAAPGQILAFTAAGIKVACGSGALLISQLQLPGKKSMEAQALLNGYSDLFRQGKTFGR